MKTKLAAAAAAMALALGACNEQQAAPVAPQQTTEAEPANNSLSCQIGGKSVSLTVNPMNKVLTLNKDGIFTMLDGNTRALIRTGDANLRKKLGTGSDGDNLKTVVGIVKDFCGQAVKEEDTVRFMQSAGSGVSNVSAAPAAKP